MNYASNIKRTNLGRAVNYRPSVQVCPLLRCYLKIISDNLIGISFPFICSFIIIYRCRGDIKNSIRSYRTKYRISIQCGRISWDTVYFFEFATIRECATSNGCNILWNYDFC